FPHLVKLLEHLIANAIKFHSDKQPEIHVFIATESKDLYTIGVKDNGVGIASAYLDKIFLMFEVLHNKEDYSGIGIGLAICKKIVEDHFGNIWVESTLGHGSTFYFTLRP